MEWSGTGISYLLFSNLFCCRALHCRSARPLRNRRRSLPRSCPDRNAQPDARPVATLVKNGKAAGRKRKMPPLRGKMIDRGAAAGSRVGRVVPRWSSPCAPARSRPEVDAFSASGTRDLDKTLQMAGKTPPARHDSIKINRVEGAAAPARLEATWPGLPARGAVDIGPDTELPQWRSTRPGRREEEPPVSGES